MAIKDARNISPRMEKHQEKNWFNHGFNHKTTLTMGALVPLACKEVYPGERVKCYAELMYKFAALFLPMMHQCYHTIDWFYVRNQSLFEGISGDGYGGFEAFIKQNPGGNIPWAYFYYKRADAIFTDGILNYMGFNAPPGSGTLIIQTPAISAIPPMAYYQIWNWFFRNPNIQNDPSFGLENADNTALIESLLPDLRVKRRNWPRDYYTIATLTPNQGGNVLIPSFATDPETGLFVGQQIFQLDGTTGGTGGLSSINVAGETFLSNDAFAPRVLQLSSTIRDFRHAAQLTEFLERATRAGGTGGLAGPDAKNIRYSDWVKRYFDWDPNPLMIDQPVWIGGYTGQIVISDVMSTAEAGTQKVGDYAGKAVARDNTPSYVYRVPDYGLIIPVVTVYPKASYYSGLEKLWTKSDKMDYMFEQFQFIGDQPMRNKEVWFSWYDADIAWNDEIFGYVPQYHAERYSNDIVSGQMRTLWESFHLGRKFVAASDVVLNDDFITCSPDIGRVFDVDAEAGEHECFLHAYVGIEIERRLSRNAVPGL